VLAISSWQESFTYKAELTTPITPFISIIISI